MTKEGAQGIAAFYRRGATSGPAAAAVVGPEALPTDQHQAFPVAQPPSQPKHPDKVVQGLRDLLRPLQIADAAMREAGSAAGVEDIDAAIMDVLNTVSIH